MINNNINNYNKVSQSSVPTLAPGSAFGWCFQFFYFCFLNIFWWYWSLNSGSSTC
jgi:hypothetical protein